MVIFRNNEMELPATKLRIGLVIFPLILLTIAPILYLFFGYPIYYSTSSIYKHLSNSSSSAISYPSPLPSRYNHSSSSSSSDYYKTSSSEDSEPSLYDNGYDDTYHDPKSSSLHNNDRLSISSLNVDHQETPKKERRRKKRKRNCDIFSGEWIPNPEAPYYTNTTCRAIHEHQNCMKFGRPDLGFMKWRWKPKECELPLFDPYEFLEIVRGKRMAFVGDSVSRNHVQSLICLLSRVEHPEDDSQQDFNFQRWKYKTYNFTIATFWTTHLVRAEETETGPAGPNSFYNLYLDEPDPTWASQIVEFDYIIISSGQWFFRPLFLFDKQKRIGCLYCYIPGVRNVGAHFAYRRALRTTFKTILGLENFKGEVFLRTFAPSHFEDGEWDKGGNCLKKRPYRSNETELEGMNLETHSIQLDEFRIAKRDKNKNNGLNLRLLDVTQVMLLRPDGHPSRFGHRPEEKVVLYNDCVHWCLPGPIDSWNDFLLDMLKNRDLTRLK
ncbi:protein trichome birefringence-like 20 [Arabidopsis lyrata subsp. lyrata]|uniref:protein trichome birefringence-like 20 n=1 Tax=Arabidopsis lyrata subsp. lyrata TaxID=81972 RepID=UPI000A29D7AA|nr:protein trichome birefringence-like 20 [Arabidopsis lyrata subsp. lyrata]|eukprot:XP_020886898.1 protein trichome birefringence-like 20 [Arabidopsis lyrata subsp. lyrata]